MTLIEFVSEYKKCAINNIPKECIADIFTSVDVDPMQQSIRDRLSNWLKENPRGIVGFRFQDSRWINFMRPPQKYKPRSSFALEAVIDFDELDFEPEEVDFSAVLELC